MNFTRVVNMHKESCDVIVDRTSIFGNPFSAGRDSTRLQVIDRYRGWFVNQLTDPEFYAAAENLKGKVLGCHCVPKPCHGHIIAAWCNGELAL